MRTVLSFAVTLFLLACGGSSNNNSGPAQIELKASGASPASVSIASSAQVQFLNHDTVDHQIASSNCSELASPRLTPNASFTATAGVGPKSCTWSDALNPTATAFQGSLSVAAPTGPGH